MQTGLYSHLLPPVVHHPFGVFEHLLPPQFEEVGGVRVELETVLPILPMYATILIVLIRVRLHYVTKPCDVRRLRTCKGLACLEAAACRTPCRLPASPWASSPLTRLAGQTTSWSGTPSSGGCLAEILK